MDNFASAVYRDTSFFDGVVYIEKLRTLSESANPGKSCSEVHVKVWSVGTLVHRPF